MDLKSLMSEMSAELDKEAASKMTSSDSALKTVAGKMLLIERDLRMPGAGSSVERIKRLLDLIEKEVF